MGQPHFQDKQEISTAEKDRRYGRNKYHCRTSILLLEAGQVKIVSLHEFWDASKKACCAVIYLCVQNNNSYYTNLVASNSRVVPLAIMTISRMELMTALILARLLSTVREYCRTFSVLHWIQGKKEYKQFEQNKTKQRMKSYTTN